MKLFIQIPCLNEAQTLPNVLAAIPPQIPGISEIEVLVINDGSTDQTAAVATAHGVQHILSHPRRVGLARTFRHGLDYCLAHGADLIVNIDGDEQYDATEIPALIQPLLDNRCDITIGVRPIKDLAHFSATKKFLQAFGSFVVRRLSRTTIADATSGFRAMTSDAARRLTILSGYTYTLEMLLQLESKGLTLEQVPVKAAAGTRPSRLMSSVSSYLAFSIATIVRVFAMYNPLRTFLYLGAVFLCPGLLISARFAYYFAMGDGVGHIQSLILAAILCIVGVNLCLIGILADIIQFNRRLLEDVLERVKKIEGRGGAIST